MYDIGTADGLPYVVSELLQGRTLRDTMSSGALPPRKAIDFAIQMASGLAAAHEAGVVHRDLKPENLFIARDGRVKILESGAGRHDVRLRAACARPSPSLARRSRDDPARVAPKRHAAVGRRAVADVHLLNLDTGALGDAYREDSIVIEPDVDHFDLLDVDRLTRHSTPSSRRGEPRRTTQNSQNPQQRSVDLRALRSLR